MSRKTSGRKDPPEPKNSPWVATRLSRRFMGVLLDIEPDYFQGTRPYRWVEYDGGEEGRARTQEEAIRKAENHVRRKLGRKTKP